MNKKNESIIMFIEIIKERQFISESVFLGLSKKCLKSLGNDRSFSNYSEFIIDVMKEDQILCLTCLEHAKKINKGNKKTLDEIYNVLYEIYFDFLKI